MAKGRFNIDFEKLNKEQKVQLFSTWAKIYFRTETFNPEVGLPERFEAYGRFIEQTSLTYSGGNVHELLDSMCKRKMDESVQAKKWA